MLTVLAGCSSPEDPGPSSLRLALEQTIGSVDGSVALTYPTGLLMLGPDTVLISQFLTGHLLILSNSGDSLGTVGRSGAGPGEFSVPAPLFVRADTLWVADNQKLHRFTRRLTYVGSIQHLLEPLGPYQQLPRPVGPLGDGLLVYRGGLSTHAAVSGRVAHVPMVTVSPDGTVVDTIALQAVGRCCVEVRLEGGAGFTGAHPAAYVDRYALDPEGQWLALLTIEETEQGPGLLLSRAGPGGDELSTLRVPVPPVLLDETFKESWISEACEGRDWPVALCRRAIAESVEWPLHRPPLEGVFVDGDRRLWLRLPHASTDSARWLIVGPSDEVEGAVTLPAHVRLLDAQGTRVWGWVEGEFDVPYLLRFRLEPTGTGR